MNTATARRPNAISSDQLSMLMQRLRDHAGIKIDSSRR